MLVVGSGQLVDKWSQPPLPAGGSLLHAPQPADCPHLMGFAPAVENSSAFDWQSFWLWSSCQGSMQPFWPLRRFGEDINFLTLSFLGSQY